LQVALPEGARDGTGRLGVLVTGWTADGKANGNADSNDDGNAEATTAAACLLLPNPSAEAAVLRPDRPFFFHLVIAHRAPSPTTSPGYQPNCKPANFAHVLGPTTP
jgi:hypothetical protein